MLESNAHASCTFYVDRRINPFNANADDADQNAEFGQSFVVRFLGSQEVITDRGSVNEMSFG